MQWVFHWLHGRGAVKQHQSLGCPRKIWINREIRNNCPFLQMCGGIKQPWNKAGQEIGNPAAPRWFCWNSGPWSPQNIQDNSRIIPHLTEWLPQLWSCSQQSPAHFCRSQKYFIDWLTFKSCSWIDFFFSICKNVNFNYTFPRPIQRWAWFI